MKFIDDKDKEKKGGGGCAILALILALMLYITSVFIFFPGLLIVQMLSDISLKMGIFWVLGIIFSATIFGILYFLLKDPRKTRIVYLTISAILFVPSFILFCKGSIFYKKFVYNTWYWEFILPLREDLSIEIEKQKALEKPPIMAFVSAKSANVRKGPGTEENVINTLNKGKEVRILITRDDWVLVQFDSIHEGWIHKSLLLFVDSLKTNSK